MLTFPNEQQLGRPPGQSESALQRTKPDETRHRAGASHTVDRVAIDTQQTSAPSHCDELLQPRDTPMSQV
jgi:hypothetical protein